MGGSRVGLPIYGVGSIEGDIASNMMVIVIINAFLGHNPLSGYRSVQDIVLGLVDVITASLHHTFCIVQLLRSVICIQVVRDLRSGEAIGPYAKDLIQIRAINASHPNGFCTCVSGPTIILILVIHKHLSSPNFPRWHKLLLIACLECYPNCHLWCWRCFRLLYLRGDRPPCWLSAKYAMGEALQCCTGWWEAPL